MARFRPFRGIRFATERVGDMNGAVAPPYDVITPAYLAELYAASPFNVTRLILNQDGHEQAGKLFRTWLAEGVLVSDDEPGFYLYTQDFESDGPRRRGGVIGALHLEEFSAGVVRPHERTFDHHKRDRLALTSEVRANLSPIFGLFSNPDFKPAPPGGWDDEPDLDVTQEGVRHRMWRITDPAAIEEIEKSARDHTIFIADGHHRYETALNYYKFCHPGCGLPPGASAPGDSENPEAHVMAFLATFEDPGMVILPTHREMLSSGGADHARLAEALNNDFEVTKFERGEDGKRALLAALQGSSDKCNAFGVALRDLDCYLLLVRPVDTRCAGGSALAGLETTVLHSLVLEAAMQAAGGGRELELSYTVDAGAMIGRVDSALSEGGFVMRATRSEQIADVCMAGELMPPKSTYFYPKLLTGLVFHSLEKAVTNSVRKRANG